MTDARCITASYPITLVAVARPTTRDPLNANCLEAFATTSSSASDMINSAIISSYQGFALESSPDILENMHLQQEPLATKTYHEAPFPTPFCRLQDLPTVAISRTHSCAAVCPADEPFGLKVLTYIALVLVCLVKNQSPRCASCLGSLQCEDICDQSSGYSL